MEVVFFSIVISILVSIVLYSYWYGISPTPSSRKAKQQLIKLIPKHKQGVLFELGSGWGTLAFSLARAYPQYSIEAYEISPIPWLISSLIQACVRYPHLTFYRADFFEAPLYSANFVVCYLYPGAMKKLKNKFERELQKGTWVISHTFAIPGWKPKQVYYLDDLYRTPIYLYQR